MDPFHIKGQGHNVQMKGCEGFPSLKINALQATLILWYFIYLSFERRVQNALEVS